ncbi:MAG: type II toxin-antitoxin system VapC family toxin [Jatrophihabitans sp.]
MSVVYDAGALMAAERNDRRLWAEHPVRLEMGVIPITTAPVIAQTSRTSRQVQLWRLLHGCDVVAFTADQAHDVGALLARAGLSDIVDAHVALIAAVRQATVLTSDPDDFATRAEHLPRRFAIQIV